MSDVSSSSTEELLQRNSWVRALARRLIAGFDAAEDLAQEALVVALQRSAAEGGTWPERRWLSGVVRRRLRFDLRNERRRTERERKVARSAAESTVLETVARAAEQKRVVSAVLELEEPHRSAVLLRYFEELEHAAIAARLGTSEEAARKRVSRGLQELKKKLARGEGGLVALWPLTGWKPVVAGLGAATLSSKPLAVAGAIAALACLGWFATSFFGAGLDDEATSPAAISATSTARERELDVAENAAVVRAGEAEPASPNVAAEAVAGSAAKGKTVLVRSIDGVSPVAGAKLHVVGEELRFAKDAPALAQSDEEGRLELPAEIPAHGWYIAHPEYFLRHFDQVALRALAEPAILELAPLGTLRIRVVDKGGAPVAGRDVYVQMDSPFGSEDQRWKWRGRVRVGTSDGDGRVETTTWPCRVELTVFAADTWKGGVKTQIDLRSRVADVVISPHAGWASLIGRVVAADGRPAASLTVNWHGTSAASGTSNANATTDADGRFRFAELETGGGELVVGAAQSAAITSELFEGEATDLGEIKLGAELALSGRLTSALPIDFSKLHVSGFRDAVQLFEIEPAANGSFATQVGDGALLVLVERRGWYDPILPHRASGLARLELETPREDLEIALEAPFGVIVFSTPASGDAAQKVELFDELEGPFEWGWLATHVAAGDIGPSDLVEGKLLSPPLAPGRYRAVLRTASGAGALSPVLEVGAGALVEHAFPSIGRGSLDVVLAAEPAQLAAGGKVEIEDEGREPRVAELDAKGAAHLAELPPGVYLLRASCGAAYATPRLVEIRAGERTQVELAAEPKAILRGRLQSNRGPLGQLRVQTQREGTNRDWAAYTDADGVFAFEPLEPGTYRVWSADHFMQIATLRGGETRELDVHVGERRVEVQVERDGKPWSGCDSLNVASCAPGHGTDLVWHRGKAIGAGRFEVDLPFGPLLFELDVPGIGNNQELLVHAAPHDGAGPLRLAPHATAVLVEARAGFEHMPPPAAYLLELSSGPVHSRWGSNPELQRERQGAGRALFPSAPPGAKLRLQGIGEHGEALRREVIVEASGTTRVAWP